MVKSKIVYELRTKVNLPWSNRYHVGSVLLNLALISPRILTKAILFIACLDQT